MMEQTVTTMNFLLYLDQKQIPCKSIRAFATEREEEYIQEGGVNDYVHIRPKPVTKPFTLEIERYVTADFTDDLPVGEALKAPLVLEVGKNETMRQEPSVRFTFKGCAVTGKSYGDINAEKGGILVETTTVTYQEMEVEKGTGG